jgi:hypothetical protein
MLGDLIGGIIEGLAEGLFTGIFEAILESRIARFIFGVVLVTFAGILQAILSNGEWLFAILYILGGIFIVSSMWPKS